MVGRRSRTFWALEAGRFSLQASHISSVFILELSFTLLLTFITISFIFLTVKFFIGTFLLDILAQISSDAVILTYVLGAFI